MTNSKNETSSHGTPQIESVAREFGEKIIKDDFRGAAEFIKAHPQDGALRERMASILIIEIETRLEDGKPQQAKKCLELLVKCAPEKREEAHMWFADYHMGEMAKSLSTGRLATFGHDLERILEYAPHRKEEAHALIAQYYMEKLKKCIDENKGYVAENKAMSELLKYGPQRKDEADHYFAERALDEMRHALDDYDKDYAKIAMGEFLKYAPHRQEEAQRMWDAHIETARKRKLYDILGLERTASEEEIKLAYRALAKRLHPDVNIDNPSAGEQMRHVNAAYAILGDPELRALYDIRGDRKEFK